MCDMRQVRCYLNRCYIDDVAEPPLYRAGSKLSHDFGMLMIDIDDFDAVAGEGLADTIHVQHAHGQASLL